MAIPRCVNHPDRVAAEGFDPKQPLCYACSATGLPADGWTLLVCPECGDDTITDLAGFGKRWKCLNGHRFHRHRSVKVVPASEGSGEVPGLRTAEGSTVPEFMAREAAGEVPAERAERDFQIAVENFERVVLERNEARAALAAERATGEAPAGLTEDEWRQVADGIITEGLRDRARSALRGPVGGETLGAHEYRIYTSAFRDSDCCGARFERICQLGEEDIFVCTRCWNLCLPRATSVPSVPAELREEAERRSPGHS